MENGKIVGQITLYETDISCSEKNITQLVLSPICVHPHYFRKGIAREMINESLSIAKRMGYGVVFLWGKPNFYSKFGFAPTYSYNIHHIQFENKNVDFIMLKELKKDSLKGIHGTIDIY